VLPHIITYECAVQQGKWALPLFTSHSLIFSPLRSGPGSDSVDIVGGRFVRSNGITEHKCTLEEEVFDSPLPSFFLFGPSSFGGKVLTG
jgi:hypothetical protein